MYAQRFQPQARGSQQDSWLRQEEAKCRKHVHDKGIRLMEHNLGPEEEEIRLTRSTINVLTRRPSLGDILPLSYFSAGQIFVGVPSTVYQRWSGPGARRTKTFRSELDTTISITSTREGHGTGGWSSSAGKLSQYSSSPR